MLSCIGYTEDNRSVYNGIFYMFDTKGIPLDIIFFGLLERNFQPSFMEFVNEARQAGWKDKTIYNRLHGAILDVYGQDYWFEVKKRLEEHCNLTEP